MIERQFDPSDIKGKFIKLVKAESLRRYLAMENRWPEGHQAHVFEKQAYEAEVRASETSEYKINAKIDKIISGSRYIELFIQKGEAHWHVLAKYNEADKSIRLVYPDKIE